MEPNPKYLQKGYYGKSGTVLIFDSSTSIGTDSDDLSGINVKILPANLEELRQELSVLINHACFLKNYAGASEGDKQIPQYEVDKLEAAIGNAQLAADKENATAQEIADAIDESHQAIKTFVYEIRKIVSDPLIPGEVTESDSFDQVFAFLSIDSFERKGEIGKDNITLGGDLEGLNVESVTRIDSYNLLFRVTGELKIDTGEGRVYIMFPHGGG